MASFFEKLWLSIFTPGTTPTLLVAANASFLALQLVFLALLVATNSIHLYVLSALCGCLWWSINWFAAEVRKGAEEEAAKAKQAEERGRGRAIGSGTESGTETEEGEMAQNSRSPAKGLSSGRETQDEPNMRKSFTEVESTDSEWDKLESEAES